MPVIQVKNFQSIKDASLEVKGFTALTGPNNAGKSALMRAVRGVFQNSPGTAFVRHGETECEVKVVFDDADVIWKKGTGSRSKPTYIVNGGNPINPGREIPQAVRDLNVTPIKAGGQEVWPTLASQFTGQVFMLDRPGSHLAEAVADIERVSQLNAALKASDKDKRATSAELKVRRKDLKQAEASLALYHGLDEVLGAIDQIAEVHRKTERIARTYTRLADMQGRLTTSRKEADRLAPIAKVEVPGPKSAQKLLVELKQAEDLLARLNTAKRALHNLAGMESAPVPETEAPALLSDLRAAERLHARMAVAQSEQIRLASLQEAPDLAAEVNMAKKLLRAVEKVEGLSGQLDYAMVEYDQVTDQEAVGQREAAIARAAVQDLVRELGICPTCGKDHT